MLADEFACVAEVGTRGNTGERQAEATLAALSSAHASVRLKAAAAIEVYASAPDFTKVVIDGVEYELVDNFLLFGGELFGSSTFDDFFQEEETPLEGLLGLKIRTSSGLNFEVGGGGGLVAGYGAPAFRVFGGLRYAEFVAPLVQSIQHLDANVTRQRRLIRRQAAALRRFEQVLAELGADISD